jgi:hypothetical protein
MPLGGGSLFAGQVGLENLAKAIATSAQALREQALGCRLVADRYGPERGAPMYELAQNLERQADELDQRAAAVSLSDLREDEEGW